MELDPEKANTCWTCMFDLDTIGDRDKCKCGRDNPSRIIIDLCKQSIAGNNTLSSGNAIIELHDHEPDDVIYPISVTKNCIKHCNLWIIASRFVHNTPVVEDETVEEVIEELNKPDDKIVTPKKKVTGQMTFG